MQKLLIAGRFIVGIFILGPISAGKLLLAHYIRGVYAIRLKDYEHAIYVRGKTSDPLLFFTIFCMHEYPAAFVNDPHFIVDAGANVGYASIYFAHNFPQARIIAIEPEETNFAMLLKNIDCYPNITAHRAALWPRNEPVTFVNPAVERWAIQCKADTHGSIPTITMRDILKDHARIDLFKCDIEGAEKGLFSESAEWLGNIGVMMLEIHHGCWKSVFQALGNYQYDCRQSGENLIVLFE